MVTWLTGWLPYPLAELHWLILYSIIILGWLLLFPNNDKPHNHVTIIFPAMSTLDYWENLT